MTEYEEKLYILWDELLKAIDRDDKQEFLNILQKFPQTDADIFCREAMFQHCARFVCTHSDEAGKKLLKIIDGINKYCPDDYRIVGSVVPDCMEAFDRSCNTTSN